MMIRLGNKTLPELDIGLNPFELADLANNPAFKKTTKQFHDQANTNDDVQYYDDLSFQMGDGLCSKDFLSYSWTHVFFQPTCQLAALQNLQQNFYDEFMLEMAGRYYDTRGVRVKTELTPDLSNQRPQDQSAKTKSLYGPNWYNDFEKLAHGSPFYEHST